MKQFKQRFLAILLAVLQVMSMISTAGFAKAGEGVEGQNYNITNGTYFAYLESLDEQAKNDLGNNDYFLIVKQVNGNEVSVARKKFNELSSGFNAMSFEPGNKRAETTATYTTYVAKLDPPRGPKEAEDACIPANSSSVVGSSQDGQRTYQLTIVNGEVSVEKCHYDVEVIFKKADGTPITSPSLGENWFVFAQAASDGRVKDISLNDAINKTTSIYQFGEGQHGNGNARAFIPGETVSVMMVKGGDADIIEGTHLKSNVTVIDNGGRFNGFTFNYDTSTPDKTVITATQDSPYRYEVEFLDVDGHNKSAGEIGLTSSTLNLNVAGIIQKDDKDYYSHSSTSINASDIKKSGTFEEPYSVNASEQTEYIAGTTVRTVISTQDNPSNFLGDGSIITINGNNYLINISDQAIAGKATISIQKLQQYQAVFELQQNNANTAHYSLNASDYSVEAKFTRGGNIYTCTKALSNWTDSIVFDSFTSDAICTPNDQLEITLKKNEPNTDYHEGDIADGYSVSFSQNGTYEIKITLKETQKVDFSTQFTDISGSLQNVVDIPNLNYRILLTKTDSDGKESYKIINLTKESNPSAGVEIDQFTDNDSKVSYYTGVETLSAKLFTGDSLESQGAEYPEGTIIPELYAVEFETNSGNRSAVLTLKKVSDSGVLHTIDVSFFEKKDEDTAYTNGVPSGTVSGDYFFRVILKHDGNDIAYAIIPAANFATKALESGKYSIDIPAGQSFIMLSNSGASVHYDPSVYDIDVRLFKANTDGQFPANLSEISAKGTEEIPNFDFWDNTYTETLSGETVTASQTAIRMYGKYDKKYQVIIESEQAVSITAGDKIILQVTAEHRTTGTDTYSGNVEFTAVPYTKVIQNERESIYEWTGSPGKVGGNEVFTVRLLQDGKEMTEGFPFKASNGKFYTVNYSKEQDKEDDSANKITTITDYVILSEYVGETALKPESVLGEAAEFGIVADTYIQSGHTETNFAVKHFKDSSNFDIGGAGDNDMPIYVGDIVNILKPSSGTNVYIDLFCTQADHEAGKIKDETSHKIRIYERDQDEINNYVQKLINYGKNKSASLQKHEANLTLTSANYDKANGVDTRMFPDNTTIYINCTDAVLAHELTIHKYPGQTIVFNIAGNHVNIGQFTVIAYNLDGTVKESVDSTTGATDYSGTGTEHNQKVDRLILEHIVFNAYEAKTVNLDTASGLFLAPKASKVTQQNGAGWILTGGTVDSKAEWHFYRHVRHYISISESSNAKLNLQKVDQDTNNGLPDIPFYIYKIVDDQEVLVTYGTTDNTGKLQLTIPKTELGEELGTKTFILRETPVREGEGSNAQELQLNSEIGAYIIQNKKISTGSTEIQATKALNTDWPEDGSITFELVGNGNAPMPDNENDANQILTAPGTVTFGTITLNESMIGKEYTYTITETVNDKFPSSNWTANPTSITATLTVSKDGNSLVGNVSYNPSNKTITTRTTKAKISRSRLRRTSTTGPRQQTSSHSS